MFKAAAKGLMRDAQLSELQLWVKEVLLNPDLGWNTKRFSIKAMHKHLRDEHGFNMPASSAHAEISFSTITA